MFPGVSEEIPISWTLDELDERLVDIQDLCSQMEMGGDVLKILETIGYDPFYDNLGDIDGEGA